MSTPDIKSLEQQAAAAIESGDPADAKRFAQACGMQPADFQAQLQERGAEQLALVVQAHLDKPGKDQSSQAVKSFEIGATQFSAVRAMFPRPHWLLRLDETGEVLESGTGGISNESVPKMQSDIQYLLDRVSHGDCADFRRRFGLPEQRPVKAKEQRISVEPAWRTKGGIPRYTTNQDASVKSAGRSDEQDSPAIDALARKLFDALAQAHEQLGVVMAHMPDGTKRRLEEDLSKRGLARSDAVRKGLLAQAYDAISNKQSISHQQVVRQQFTGSTIHEFGFDVKLQAAIRVMAASPEQATQMLHAVMNAAECNAGAWPNGDPVLFEASTADGAEPVLFSIDGEDLQNASGNSLSPGMY